MGSVASESKLFFLGWGGDFLPCIVGGCIFHFLSFLYKLFSFSVPNVLAISLFEIKSLRRKALAMRNVFLRLQGCVTRYHSVLGTLRNQLPNITKDQGPPLQQFSM